VDPLSHSDAKETIVSTEKTQLIDGVWENTELSRQVLNPADGTVVGSVAWGSAIDAARAADAAQAAFGPWAETTARQRGDLLLEASRILQERSGDIAVTLAREAGKRLPEAQGELAFTGEYLRWFAEQARRPDGEVIPHEAAGRRHLTVRRPTGVVASLSPWNFPCSIQARKLAPALAAGCTVVARVSEKAPLAVTEVIRCLSDAGMPDGVLNLVHGPGPEVTQELLRHPAVRVVTFTGSTEVGRQIMASAAQRVVRPLLELGGEAAYIVFDDADLEAAVEGALVAKFRNTGQSCIGANRFLVHESIYDRFVAMLVERVDAMSIGDGLARPCPDLGPVIDDERASAVSALVDDALAAGATKLTREFDLPRSGSFVAPALLADVPPDAALSCSEVFGPVAAVTRFRDEDEAVRLANQSELGLAGYFWSRDVGRCWRLAERLQVGIVGVNNALPSVAFAPMGGVKQSGLGREGAGIGLEEFTDVRYVSLGL
jgi:succinate-semialdehyde dehydrogenase/glutarate-semialdehyde dehydrogenase